MNRALPSFNQAEERNKLSHFTTQGFDLNGVIQAGANDGEEMENFIRMGIEHYVGFEPLPSAYKLLMQNWLEHGAPEDYHFYQIGLDRYNGSGMLKTTIGDGKGSSLLETVWDHPEVVRNWNQGQAAIDKEITIPVLRFDTWMHGFDLTPYDTLQLDTQGNEMEILEGMGDYLQGFKFLCIEVSEVPVYEGETDGGAISEWLDERGFLRDSPITAHNDTFWIRKDIKSVTDGQYKGRC